VEAKVPFLDLAAEVDSLWPEIRPAVEEVLRSGRFILGANVDALEAEVATYLGVTHAIALGSGTDALVLGLEGLGIEPGDEVITTPFTFIATAEAIHRVGATPVFVDVDAETFNLNPSLVEERITPRTRGILPVHLFGHPADMGRLGEIADRHGLLVLEDGSQAFGAEWEGKKIGGIGAATTFSMYPTKNFAAYGDAGFLSTNDATIAERVRLLRNHGCRDMYRAEMHGYNSRLDEIQAAILRVKLPRIDGWNESRRVAAQVYGTLLGDVAEIRVPSEAGYAHHIYHQYTLRVEGGGRDRVRERLAAAGIATAIYYPVPIHQLSPYRSDVKCPVAERVVDEVLCLPVGPHVSPDTAKRVANEVLAAVRGAGA
jgi:dTDP-4-amino-4,6-dideoxygalactose transaminase